MTAAAERGSQAAQGSSEAGRLRRRSNEALDSRDCASDLTEITGLQFFFSQLEEQTRSPFGLVL